MAQIQSKALRETVNATEISLEILNLLMDALKYSDWVRACRAHNLGPCIHKIIDFADNITGILLQFPGSTAFGTLLNTVENVLQAASISSVDDEDKFTSYSLTILAILKDVELSFTAPALKVIDEFEIEMGNSQAGEETKGAE